MSHTEARCPHCGQAVGDCGTGCMARRPTTGDLALMAAALPAVAASLIGETVGYAPPPSPMAPQQPWRERGLFGRKGKR